MQPEAPEGMRYQTDPAYISFIDLSLTCLYEVRSELDAVIRWREDNKDPTAPSPPAEPTLDRVGPSADPSPPSDSTFNGRCQPAHVDTEMEGLRHKGSQITDRYTIRVYSRGIESGIADEPRRRNLRVEDEPKAEDDTIV
ncbi:MAG: hypothetical protein LQ337_003326 [Flavoplaca oasis]|nr:MAG: hypothetical protein LQ337_003326 [Flavoplaca oasis]